MRSLEEELCSELNHRQDELGPDRELKRTWTKVRWREIRMMERKSREVESVIHH